jgi:hypothetical protein
MAIFRFLQAKATASDTTPAIPKSSWVAGAWAAASHPFREQKFSPTTEAMCQVINPVVHAMPYDEK